jgi:hypothetical protein
LRDGMSRTSALICGILRVPSGSTSRVKIDWLSEYHIDGRYFLHIAAILDDASTRHFPWAQCDINIFVVLFGNVRRLVQRLAEVVALLLSARLRSSTCTGGLKPERDIFDPLRDYSSVSRLTTVDDVPIERTCWSSQICNSFFKDAVKEGTMASGWCCSKSGRG